MTENVIEADKVATDATQEAPSQEVIGAEFDIQIPFMLENTVCLWEVMTTDIIESRITYLDDAINQLDAALAADDAPEADSDERKVLDAKVTEATRQRKQLDDINDGDLMFKAKTKGYSEIRAGVKWNESLERHVVVDDGVVVRVLPFAPI